MATQWPPEWSPCCSSAQWPWTRHLRFQSRDGNHNASLVSERVRDPESSGPRVQAERGSGGLARAVHFRPSQDAPQQSRGFPDRLTFSLPPPPSGSLLFCCSPGDANTALPPRGAQSPRSPHRPREGAQAEAGGLHRGNLSPPPSQHRIPGRALPHPTHTRGHEADAEPTPPTRLAAANTPASGLSPRAPSTLRCHSVTIPSYSGLRPRGQGSWVARRGPKSLSIQTFPPAHKAELP